MSARRGMPFGSSGDSGRDAAAPALAALRSELLVMPREELVEDHVDMMLFEAQLLATPRFAKTRAALPRPRRAAFVFVSVCATLASCGLSAAGALPEPLQHITDSIARTLGVPQPHDAKPAAPHSAASTPKATAPRTTIGRPAPSTTIHHATSPVTPKHTKVTRPKAAHTHTPAPVVQHAQSVLPQIAKARPTKPPKRITPRTPGKKPSNNSTNTPAGYPDNWRTLAAAATDAKLAECARADSLSPAGCPQVATPADAAAPAESVQWSLVTGTPTNAVVVARVHSGGPNKAGPATTVTVYEPFGMGATYTQPGATHAYRVFSGGIAAATMTWSGSGFENVTFSSGSAANHILPGVTVPPLQRPAGVADSAVLAVVQAGFAECVTPPITAGPAPTCALSIDAAKGPWSVVGDPTQGAVVTFNADRGDFTVAGTYSVTAADGTAASGSYTATLFFDGQNFQILSISGA